MAGGLAWQAVLRMRRRDAGRRSRLVRTLVVLSAAFVLRLPASAISLDAPVEANSREYLLRIFWKSI